LFGNGLAPNVVDLAALQFETAGVQYDPPDMAILSNVETPAGQPTVTQAQLVTSNGQCFSALGVSTYKNLQNFVTSAKAATMTLAPGTAAYNSEVVNGTGVQYANTLTGNLRAVQVVGANGTKFYILYRCGNIVTSTQTPGTPTIPTVPSPTTPSTPSTVPSTTPTTLPCVVGNVVRDKCDNPEPTRAPDGYGGPGAGGSAATPGDNNNNNPPPSGCNPGGSCPNPPAPTPTSTTAPPTDWTVPVPTPGSGYTPPSPSTTVPNSTLPPPPSG
jgi:hypothetical protein